MRRFAEIYKLSLSTINYNQITIIRIKKLTCWIRSVVSFSGLLSVPETVRFVLDGEKPFSFDSGDVSDSAVLGGNAAGDGSSLLGDSSSGSFWSVGGVCSSESLSWRGMGTGRVLSSGTNGGSRPAPSAGVFWLFSSSAAAI